MNPRTRRQRRQARKWSGERNAWLVQTWATAPRRDPWGAPKQCRMRWLQFRDVWAAEEHTHP